jgi:3-isopropylmalate/(R)-2-methylmalate dehydratase small subunit
MNEPLRCHTGVAAVLLRDNVDTDQIIPSREMKTVSQKGLAEGLFAGWRYTNPEDRRENPDFVLNQVHKPRASILVSGLNFGCGSSREHAVWALGEYGFRVVIAKSFGEIFYGNCFRNGVLPISLSADEINLLATHGDRLNMTVSLEGRWVRCEQRPGWQASFEIGEYPRCLLLEGLDPISLTLRNADQIDLFLESDLRDRPWVYPAH